LADGRHLKKSKNVVLINVVNRLLKTGNKTANINVKTAVYTNFNGDGSKTAKII